MSEETHEAETDAASEDAGVQKHIDPKHAAMFKMIRAFPTLVPFADGIAAGPTFEPEVFARWASGGHMTHGSSQAAAFVLTVWNNQAEADGGWWNQGSFSVGRFDIVHALSVWDTPHKSAFFNWCHSPFWP